MPNYRRVYIENHPIFITMVTANRASILIKNIEHLKQSIYKIKQRHPFQMRAYVVLPDHCHFLIQLPQQDVNFSLRINLIKGDFSRTIAKKISKKFDNARDISLSKLKHREKGIWQRRFWDHVIRDDLDYSRHLDYIHYNPIKHSYVKHLKDWPYSSFQHFVNKGYYDPSWASHKNEDFDSFFDVDAGE